MTHRTRMINWIQRVGLPVLLVLIAGPAHAEPLQIANQTLSASYDASGATFSITEKATGKAFLIGGKFESAEGRATVEPVTHEVFGTGRRIVVKRGDGGEDALVLCDGLPFVLVCGTRHNSGTDQLDVTRTVPAVFTLDLGKPAAELRTMGTAGLTAPDKHPGSYLFLTLADPATRRGVVTGFVTNDRGSGVLFSGIKDGRVEFKAQVDYGHLRLAAGESAKTETLAIGIFDDARLGEEAYADALAKQYHIKLRPQVNGYCTWYSDKHRGASDEKAIVELAEFAAKELKPFGFSFVQIDDEWQGGGTYNGPRRGFDRVKPDGPYPHGMAPVAKKINDLGLTAGIWFLPFGRNHQDPEYKDRQHWFVKRDNGQPYETSWGGTSLDLTHPEVQAHLAALVRTIHGWGFNYFKMDGLWTGSATEQIYVNDGYRDDHVGSNAPFHDPKKTNIEVFRSGLKLLREAAGPDVFFSGCNVSQNMRSLGGSIGLVDSMRIGPDNGSDWKSLIVGPLRGTRLYFLHGRTWWNDPDPSYVRASIPLNHARLLTSWVAVSGAFNLNSDWLPGLPADRLEVMKRTMPHHGATARPVDYFERDMPRVWLVTDTRQKVRRDVLGLFNWDDKSQEIACPAAKAGLDPAANYHAFDFWANQSLPDFKGEFKFEVPAQSCRVIAVRSAQDHPVLVSTSRHVSQGILEVTGEAWNAAERILSGTSQVVAGDAYELRIAGLTDGGHRWVPALVAAYPLDQGPGVSPSLSNDAGLLRVTIKSSIDQAVQWSVKFEDNPLPK